MSVQVALHHRSRYLFDRPTVVLPHIIRLRPLAHGWAQVAHYALTIRPDHHHLHWQQDINGNHIAQLVVPDLTCALDLSVDLVVTMTPVNPFAFLLDPPVAGYPFEYPPGLEVELAPFLRLSDPNSDFAAWVSGVRRSLPSAVGTVEMLLGLSRRVCQMIRYLERPEPGIQEAHETLRSASGSCRDNAWLLLQTLRHLGIATRFVSGYLVELSESPGLPHSEVTAGKSDRVALHAWCDVYLPGAGWVGLDATSGQLTTEGHIPLAAAAQPPFTAPIVGRTGPCSVRLEVGMSVTRVACARANNPRQ